MLQKRIGIACNRLASGGGMESHALDIITELARQGYQPVIFTKNHKPLAAVEKFEIFSCHTKMIPRAAEDWYFSRWLKKQIKASGITSCIGFCRNTESDILFCGGTHRGFASRRRQHFVYDTITNRFEDSAFKRAKFILPASQFIAQELKSLYGVNTNKIVIAYPPVSTRRFQCLSNSERLQARIELGLSPNKTVLLFPSASGHERKGLPFILESLTGLDHIELAVAGKPPQTNHPSVVSIGYQTDMERAYNAADYTILASYYEPFDLVGIESVLCGTPVLLADAIGCTEVLSHTACQTFSRDNSQNLRSLLTSLNPSHRTSVEDLHYDPSVEHQVQMLLSLLAKIDDC